MQHAMEMFRKATPTLRKPTSEDGAAIWELIRACKPLDENSMYCNLIQCDHFRDTCVLAELDGTAAGWVSGHLLPDDPETLFVWQVAVSGEARGMGLGKLMLQNLLARDECKDVKRLQTTITSDNDASWSLFRRFAQMEDGQMGVEPYFTEAVHFDGRHNSEYKVTIDLQERMEKVV